MMRRVCPTCNEINELSAFYCTKCGVPIGSFEPTESEPADQPQANGTVQQSAVNEVPSDPSTVQCPSCRQSQTASELCAKCGVPLPRAVVWIVTWPWNEDTQITSALAIGRDSSPDWLKRRFEQLNLDVLSREHARIDIQGEQITVTDLGSTNGTFVNGTRLQARNATTLRSGDVLRFSSSGPQITVHRRSST